MEAAIFDDLTLLADGIRSLMVALLEPLLDHFRVMRGFCARG